jgi:glutamine amidotransferase
MPHIAIVHFGMGNLHSVRRKFDRLGVTTTVTSDPSLLLSADKLVLPGVGHFGQAMENLRSLNLLDALEEAVRVNRIPVLGICLGMQLMGTHSEEGDAEGFGWIDAETIRIRVPDPLRFKVPHVGWARIAARKESALLQGLREDAEFYFVHSYNLKVHSPELVLCESEYGNVFPSAIEHENLFGVQFHPEKSHADGERLLKNFVEL